jgi:hypothetical protein
MKFLVYLPWLPEANSDGIVIRDILCATIRLNGNNKGVVRFITGEDGWHWEIDDIHKHYVDGGFLRQPEKVFAAEEGTEFNGWNRSKQYRLTKEEIKPFVIESEKKVENGTKIIFKVFYIPHTIGDWDTHNYQNRGLLIK